MTIPGPIDPPHRLLMGPGPISAYPSVLRAMSAPLVGQYDPFMTATMAETQELYRGVWGTHNDATLLIEDGHRVPDILVDQGTADGFLDEGLRPWLLDDVCKKAGIGLTLRMQEGYDHSYFFISSFMADHVAWAAERLARA